jgi:antitoxin component YwqK of YwqJK toxin-antitoxin module
VKVIQRSLKLKNPRIKPNKNFELMKLRFSLIFLLVSCVGCTEREVDINSLNKNSDLFIYKGEKYTGKVIKGNDSFHCINGKINGEYIITDQNGKELIHEYYSNGLLQGEALKYYSNGQLECRINYLNGKYNGKYEKFNVYGKKEFEGNFKNGIENGFFRVDEKKNHFTFNYLNGQLNGKLRVFDEEGTLSLVRFYEKGSLLNSISYNYYGEFYDRNYLGFCYPLNRHFLPYQNK